MYDMKPMAQSLASQGRYGDTMLVHMNPVEVAGLDAYTRKMGGGGLTVNPRTGQPEAFLPFLLGLGLQGLGMTALQAGLATGIGTAVATKDLGKGVLAGLGAFGGADVGAGLGAAGATSATSAVPATAGADIVAGASQATQVAGLPGAAPASGSLLQSAGTSSFAPPTGPASFAPTASAPLMPTYGPGAPIEPSSIATGFTQPIAPPPPLSSAVTEGAAMAQQASLTAPTGGFSEMGRGIEALGTEPGRAAFMKSVGGGGGLATDIGFGALSSDAFMDSEGAGGDSPSLIRPYDFDPATRRFTARNPYRAPGPEYKFQAGGLASQVRTGYRDGNMVRGQGDGMSDEITATIEGEQDVLLSDGEYVIPADVVAMLGNGSSESGEEVITNMIKRLRMKKYGRDKQPPELNEEEMLPA
jgi:hypothetical protein